MKEYSNDTLGLDDLLKDVKRHAGQLDLILKELKTRGAEPNGYAIIREYSNLSDAIARFAIVNFEGEPFLYGDGRLIVTGTREEAELILKADSEIRAPLLGLESRMVIKELK